MSFDTITATIASARRVPPVPVITQEVGHGPEDGAGA